MEQCSKLVRKKVQRFISKVILFSCVWFHVDDVPAGLTLDQKVETVHVLPRLLQG